MEFLILMFIVACLACVVLWIDFDSSDKDGLP